MEVDRLSALRTSRLYPPGNIPGTDLCWGHAVAQLVEALRVAGSIPNGVTEIFH
jgi:hypothetical protein